MPNDNLFTLNGVCAISFIIYAACIESGASEFPFASENCAQIIFLILKVLVCNK